MRQSPALLGVFLFCGEWIEVGGDKRKLPRRDRGMDASLHFITGVTGLLGRGGRGRGR